MPNRDVKGHCPLTKCNVLHIKESFWIVHLLPKIAFLTPQSCHMINIAAQLELRLCRSKDPRETGPDRNLEYVQRTSQSGMSSEPATLERYTSATSALPQHATVPASGGQAQLAVRKLAAASMVKAESGNLANGHNQHALNGYGSHMQQVREPCRLGLLFAF